MTANARPLPKFRSPADQVVRDLSGSAAELREFESLWNDYLDGIAQQAIVGNPWQASYSSNTTSYFNPLTTDIPPSAKTQAVQWSALPGRIMAYNVADWSSRLSQTQVWQLADFGWQPSPGAPGAETFPEITDPCSAGPGTPSPYGPYGPRGWQDEYCEWSVLRDSATGNIIRIDFTCENPEYWYTLWRVAPDVVLDLYRSTLDNPAIQLSDLWLMDASGHPVIDPTTQSPAYNPLNRFNCGPLRTTESGGAMHLTSTPNTLQTEIGGLAGTATIQRSIGAKDPAKLICCSQYGQPFRNSDPHIGQIVNLLVGQKLDLTIADPPGLYIQTPNFSQYALPSNAPIGAGPADYWTVKRGAMSLNDMYGVRLPGNFILHATYEVPPGLGFTVSDITIAGTPIRYAAQIAATFLMQINALAIPAGQAVQSYPCVGTPAEGTPQPLQLMGTSLWDAYYGSPAPVNPVGVAMVLASNTVVLPPTLARGASQVPMTLICTGAAIARNGELPKVTFDGPSGDVTVTVLALTDDVTYAVPGNTYPSSNQALSLLISVSGSAQVGLRGVSIANTGQPTPQAAPSFLRIT